MTKREEIRRGIEKYSRTPAALWAYLHSQGLVILPSMDDCGDCLEFIEPLVDE